MSSRNSFTVTYKNPGALPPVYIAGSFSDPEWQPQEMKHETDQDGQIAFRSEVHIEPGKDYQFKLRIGDGDWWALSDDYPVVTDNAGNQNNLLKLADQSRDEEIAPAGVDTPAISLHHDSNTTDLASKTGKPTIDNRKEDGDDYKTPLFAHECLGAYDLGEDESDHEAVASASSSPNQRTKRTSREYTPVDVDMNDPTLEKFPSDRTSIMGALRHIQTHLDEDQTHLEDIPSSPRPISARRASIESNDDISLSPMAISPTSTRRRESRHSHSSFGRARSPVSLGAIAEEPKPPAEESKPTNEEPESEAEEPTKQIPTITLPNPNSSMTHAGTKPPRVEEDEAVAMKHSQVKPNEEAHKSWSSQVESNEPSNGASDDEPSIIGAKSNGHQPSEAQLQTKAQVQAPSTTEEPVLKEGRSPKRDGVMDTTAVDGWFRMLFTQLFQRLPILLATGAVALAVRIGWWKRADK